MKKIKNVYSDEILVKDFLNPSVISVYKLSKDIGLTKLKISDIIKGKEKVTDYAALRLSIFFGNSVKFWHNTQKNFDTEVEKRI